MRVQLDCAHALIAVGGETLERHVGHDAGGGDPRRRARVVGAVHAVGVGVARRCADREQARDRGRQQASTGRARVSEL
jgi:hypothetical protein